MFIVTYILLKFQLDIKLWHIWYAHVLWGVIGNVLGNTWRALWELDWNKHPSSPNPPTHHLKTQKEKKI